mgnify:CR=1 FL=1
MTTHLSIVLSKLVSLINSLYNDGNFIKIVTARGCKSCSNFSQRKAKYYDMNVIGLSCIYLGLSIEEALKAATWSGACALNEQERIGSIEVGKQADLIIWDLDKSW